MNKVLVCHEKHGESYYDASTDEALHRAALSILQLREEQGWYMHPDEVYHPEERKTYTDEEIAALPEEFQEQARKTQKRAEATAREYQYALKDWALHEKALDEEDGEAAWKFLRSHSDYEYERVSIEYLEEV